MHTQIHQPSSFSSTPFKSLTFNIILMFAIKSYILVSMQTEMNRQLNIHAFSLSLVGAQ